MDLKLISKNENGTVKFIAKGTTPTFLNAYRRMIINKVPSMAIDEVEFVNNSSALYDEMLAHRLGLLVLKTDTKSYFVRENCKCKGAGCARCTLNLTLEAQGPSTVYAEQIKSADPSVIPVHPKAILAKLLEGQEIKLVATATMGTGKEHIKFSPGLMYYQKYPSLNTKDTKKAQAIVQSCPIDKDKSKFEPHDVCKACLGALESAGMIKTNDDDYLVTIEPWGQLTAQEIVENTAEVIDENLDELTALIKKIK